MGGWVGGLVGALSPVNHKGYIRTEGDFHKEIVERTNEREIRPKEQSEKAESCRENFWMKYS